MAELRVVATDELTADAVEELRALMLAAFEDDFSDEDWANSLGGRHAIVAVEGVVVSHAALVERMLVAGDRRLRAGYVEGVATAPDHRRQGHGSVVMRTLHDIVVVDYDIGGLSTGAYAFYGQLGWERWQGRTFVNRPDGRQPTPEDDDGVMVLRTPRTTDLDLTADLVCEWRPGDVW